MPSPWRKNDGICPTCGRKGYRPDIPEVALGTAIRLAREKKGWSQEEFGKRLDPPLSRGRIVAMETGNRRIDVIELCNIARILGKPMAYFWELLEEPDERALSADRLVCAPTLPRCLHGEWMGEREKGFQEADGHGKPIIYDQQCPDCGLWFPTIR